MIIQAIISGGQTGADKGGLLAARELGLHTGGYAPKGWRTETGPDPTLEEFGLIEHESENYPDRTRDNVTILSEGTVIFGRRSRGSNLTEEVCRVSHKPCCWVMWPCQLGLQLYIAPSRTTIISPSNHRAFRLWLKRNKINTLNCAGNRESKNPGIQEFTRQFLMEALHEQ